MTASVAAPRPAPGGTNELEVVDKRLVADDVCSITLAAPDRTRLRDWAPGAHLDLVLPDRQVRQYSLCGDRWDARSYRVAVLREPAGRGGSAQVHDQVAVGDRLEVGGPRNNFRMAPARRYLFLAGGIGITPLLPMIVQANLEGAEWTLHYGGRSRRSMAFLDELERFGRRVVPHPQDEVGLMDLPQTIGPPDDHAQIYACGPAGFLEAVEAGSRGWRARALRTERFAAAPIARSSGDTAFEVELARRGDRVRVPAGRSVLEALRDIGVDVLSSCGQGVCGTCEVSVISGTPEPRDSILDPASPDAGRTMFVCVSRAQSDRLVLDL